MVSKVRIGVLALQGDFAEHIAMLEQLSSHVIKVKKKSDLDEIDGLIIPGGESTTIKKLIDRYNFEESIKNKVNSGMALWGTCAGLICIADKLTESEPKPMGLLKAEVSRNWFGRQIDSFETDVSFKGIIGKIKAVFIRAPIVNKVNKEVEILSRLNNNEIIAIKQNKILGTSFHPEISGSTKVHQYFINLSKT